MVRSIRLQNKGQALSRLIGKGKVRARQGFLGSRVLLFQNQASRKVLHIQAQRNFLRVRARHFKGDGLQGHIAGQRRLVKRVCTLREMRNAQEPLRIRAQCRRTAFSRGHRMECAIFSSGKGEGGAGFIVNRKGHIRERCAG